MIKPPLRPLAFGLVLLIAFAVAGVRGDAGPKDAGDPGGKPDGEGFVSLFNGKDLTGWRAIGDAEWKVEDGVIVGGQAGDPRRAGVLTTEKQFKDFELVLDFMIDEHGKYNSGVYLRNEPGNGAQTGYQVNIGRGAAGEFTGGVYAGRWLAKGDEKDEFRKPLQWNTLRIRAEGGHVVVHLNAKQVSDCTDPDPAEKFVRAGVIALQTYGAEGHAGWVKFRDIKVKEMK